MLNRSLSNVETNQVASAQTDASNTTGAARVLVIVVPIAVTNPPPVSSFKQAGSV